MIQSRTDYQNYLKADAIALGIDTQSGGLKGSIRQLVVRLTHPTWKFQRMLRRLEYIRNCRGGLIGKIYGYYYTLRFNRYSLKLGFSIPANVFGPGLAIPHYGTIVVNEAARIGKNCKLHVCTNIGASGGESKAPQIGDNVYIAPGVKIFGDITIANNTAIAANSTVNKSSEESNIILGGTPAKKLKEYDISKIIPYHNQ